MRYAVDIERITWERYIVEADTPAAAADALREVPDFERSERFESPLDWDAADGSVMVYEADEEGDVDPSADNLLDEGESPQLEALHALWDALSECLENPDVVLPDSLRKQGLTAIEKAQAAHPREA